METKREGWTPGPWAALGPSIESDRGRVAWQGFGRKRGMSARLSNDEQDANARLIAAAPELADVLQAIVDCPDYKDIRTHEMAAGRALLQRIRGEGV